MLARTTGFAMLSSASVQEAMDFALIAQAATLESRIPFLHFFDGFRTSHEVSKIEMVTEDVMRQMINDEFVIAHRQRALNPERPVLRGTAQNPDVFFQAREACNPFYAKCADITAQGDGQVCRDHRPRIQAVPIRRRPERRARGDHHGLRRRDGA